MDLLEAGQPRSIYRTVNSGGSFGANPLIQHIGLGGVKRVDRLEVYWPTSDSANVVQGVDADRLIRIVEGEDGYEVLRPPFASEVRGGLGD